MKRSIAVLLLALLLTGCAPEAPVETQPQATQSQLFSDRDLESGYDAAGSASIQLSGGSASCDSNAVSISGSTVTIQDEGTYLLSGTLDDGMIIVDADKSDKVQLVLEGASIHCETSAPIYIRQADKVFLTLAENSENTLSCGESYTAIDENNIDSVIFSKEDLTLNGGGSLTLSSPAGHGIVSKDELTVTGGSYDIRCASHGLDGKDSVAIAGGSFTIAAGKDGIHAENDEDAALGLVYIEGGTFDITAEGDGISAGSTLEISGGSYNILTGGGSANAETQTSQGWGGFMGGRGPGGGGGGPMGMPGQNQAEETSEDSTSIKGLKATGELTLNGGDFTIDSADDAIHSNSSITVSGGAFRIATGDDGFHADETLTISSGAISISESYEGLEGLHILVSGGEIDLVSSDDGLNAAGGTDSSGMGGMRGPDQFGGGMGGASNGSISISDGSLYVQASGDGIDANGSLEISGGYTVVCGPTVGDTATLDYDTSATISGGTFIGTGSSMMAQSFSQAQQGVIALSVGNRSAGTQITLTDESGSQILSYAPELDFAVVILSSPDIVQGQNYSITIGTDSGTFAAN